MAERVSHKPWGRFSESDYTLEQLARASLIHMQEPPKTKADCKLPIREPDGTLNANGIVAAAIRIHQTDAPMEKKRKAARKLVSLYRNVLNREPPDSLKRLAVM